MYVFLFCILASSNRLGGGQSFARCYSYSARVVVSKETDLRYVKPQRPNTLAFLFIYFSQRHTFDICGVVFASARRPTLADACESLGHTAVNASKRVKFPGNSTRTPTLCALWAKLRKSAGGARYVPLAVAV